MRFFRATNLSAKPLKFQPGVWDDLMKDLRDRGRGYRESGAFLLSDALSEARVVSVWLPYDELAPESLAYNYIRLESSAFSRLWEWCEARRLKVVADVHTHPTGPKQSLSDREHPMLALAGHIALIVPWFAQRRPKPRNVGYNIYKGNGEWTTYYRWNAAKRIIAP